MKKRESETRQGVVEMKKAIGAALGVVLAVGIMFLFMGFGGSQKIGLVDVSEIIAESDAGKDASAKLQGYINTRQTEVQKKRDKLVQMQQSLQEDQDALAQEALEEKKAELTGKTREFEQFVSRVRQDIRKRDQTLSEKLLPEIRKIVRGIGHQKGYTMIMDINSGRIIYHTQNAAITDRVLERFNEQYNTGELDLEPSDQE